MAQERDRWRAVVNAVMNLRVLAPRNLFRYRLLNVVSSIRAQGIRRGVCGVQRDSRASFSLSPSVFPADIISPLFHIHSYIICGIVKRPVRGQDPQRRNIFLLQQ
jgi:hypothetical protein